MDDRLSSYKGCLLGLAVGDALGYTVDALSLDRIRADYGPGGILGYDLCNGYAETTSYTQTAAYSCNGLLLGMTRGQMRGAMAPYVRYIALALQEWARMQGYRREPGARRFCWVSGAQALQYRRCMDTKMLDTLNSGALGTMEEPKNRCQGPGALCAAIPVGLFFDPGRLEREEIQRLGAETVALTHGDPNGFLAGAALAHMISRITWDGQTDLKALTQETITVLQTRFGREYRQTAEVCLHLRSALSLAVTPNVNEAQALEQMSCTCASRVLAGAVYACLLHPRSFDECMIAAVNHSGASAAVGAVAGALLGAMLGADAIPEFYLEPMEAASVLQELAVDMFQGCPMTCGNSVFDMEWDEKYVSIPG